MQKTFLIKKNHLTCDHTTREVLTTSIDNNSNLLQTNRTNIVTQEKEVSQIWCRDQDSELLHDEICIRQ